MVTLCRKAFGCLLLLCTAVCPAQRQTEAPAGIAAPALPVSTTQGDQDSGTAQRSRVFQVRVVDGRDAAPIRDARVRLWYDEPAGPGYQFATDAAGVGAMPSPVGTPVRILAEVTNYTDCRRPMRGDPPQGYSLEAIRQSGMAAQNGCGAIGVRTRPGELVLFVRPARWYEGINRVVGN